MHLLILFSIDSPFPQVSSGSGTITNVLNIALGIAGGLSLVFVTFGGFKYVLSRGEPQETAKAKDTILYAVIGLAVTVLAGVIVNFVIGKL